METIVNLSGGKDSTAMLFKLLEHGEHIDEVVFCDTSVEFPQMYDHIAQVEKLSGLTVTRLSRPNNFEYMLLEYVKKKGKNKGTHGYSFPDFRNRWCTAYYKRDRVKEYLKGRQCTQCIGIAMDEQKRVNELLLMLGDVRYPLIEYSMTEQDCMDYCKQLGFTWGGLYDKFDRVSCWCCPLKKLKDLETLYNEFPELWERLMYWQRNTYRKFRVDASIIELTERFMY